MTSVRHVVAASLRAAAAVRAPIELAAAKKNTAFAALALLSLSGVAFAQEEAPAEGGATLSTLDEVTVTGSRIRRTSDFDTANPTTVVDEQYIKNLGLVNVGDVVAQLPANLSNNTPNTTGNANFFAGSTIANL